LSKDFSLPELLEYEYEETTVDVTGEWQQCTRSQFRAKDADGNNQDSARISFGTLNDSKTRLISYLSTALSTWHVSFWASPEKCSSESDVLDLVEMGSGQFTEQSERLSISIVDPDGDFVSQPLPEGLISPGRHPGEPQIVSSGIIFPGTCWLSLSDAHYIHAAFEEEITTNNNPQGASPFLPPVRDILHSRWHFF